MTRTNRFDVIIVGGSYAGIAAGMALGRALRRVLIIDSGEPCNIQTPYSHNFLTQDGKTPKEIIAVAKQQMNIYNTVEFLKGLVTKGFKAKSGYQVEVTSGEEFFAKKLIFATGIKDILPDISGIPESWAISVLHCPYCHGYEVRNKKTGVLGNGLPGFEFSSLISNWTDDLTLYTDGRSTLSPEQVEKLSRHNINIVESEIERLLHANGHVQYIVFKNGYRESINVLYTRCPFVQHCNIPQLLGCELNEQGYIKTDSFQKTTIPGIFACGDNVTLMRTVANAVAMGTATGVAVNKELIEEEF